MRRALAVRRWPRLWMGAWAVSACATDDPSVEFFGEPCRVVHLTTQRDVDQLLTRHCPQGVERISITCEEDDSVVDLEPLAGLDQLKSLSISECRELESLAVVGQWSNLGSLFVQDTPIQRLPDAPALDELHSLELRNTGIKDSSRGGRTIDVANHFVLVEDHVDDLSMIRLGPDLDAFRSGGDSPAWKRASTWPDVHGVERIGFFTVESFALEDFEVFENLHAVERSFELQAAPRLKALPDADFDGAHVRIFRAPALDSIQSLQGRGAGSINSLTLVDTGVESLTPLMGLARIFGELIIRDNHALESLDGLESLSFVVADIIIRDNPQLRDLDSLEQLDSTECQHEEGEDEGHVTPLLCKHCAVYIGENHPSAESEGRRHEARVLESISNDLALCED